MVLKTKHFTKSVALVFLHGYSRVLFFNSSVSFSNVIML